MEIQELGHVVLYVTDVIRLANFYRDTLGFREIKRSAGIALFSSGRTHHELLLIEIGGAKPVRAFPTPGLYHIGLKVGNSHEDIVRTYKELTAKGVTIVGTADHTITHSIYVLDPDGNELELYADVSDRWNIDPEAILTRVKPLMLD